MLTVVSVVVDAASEIVVASVEVDSGVTSVVVDAASEAVEASAEMV